MQVCMRVGVYKSVCVRACVCVCMSVVCVGGDAQNSMLQIMLLVRVRVCHLTWVTSSRQYPGSLTVVDVGLQQHSPQHPSLFLFWIFSSPQHKDLVDIHILAPARPPETMAMIFTTTPPSTHPGAEDHI